MLQVARLAPNVLQGSTELVHSFFAAQQNSDGGFKDRTGKSDLYYTVFGLEGLMALRAQIQTEAATGYLDNFGSGESLDFIHLCCLARCWAALNKIAPCAGDILAGIETHRTPDGGYNVLPHSRKGTVYADFLALGAYQDSKATLPDAAALVRHLSSLETPDGAWANEPGLKVGSTNSTAAAILTLLQFGEAVRPEAGRWLLSHLHAQGGFMAGGNAPVPDLLTTATTLHALAALEIPFEPFREQCLDFVDSLWTNEGGFHGHWSDDFLDCEYTYYGLLALGHLSL